MDRDEGFREFVVQRGPALSRIAYLLIGDHQLAEDLVQTALARTAARWPRVVAAGNPEAYVRRVMVNERITWWRRRRYETVGRTGAIALDVVAGPDDRDRWSLPAPTVRYEEAVESLGVSGLRARWTADLGFATTDPEVVDVTRSAAEALAGAAGLPLDEEPVVLTDPVKTWLSAGALDLWLAIEEDMWPAGADDLTAYSAMSLRQTEEYPLRRYARALRRRQVLQDDVARLFSEIDVLLLPTTAVPAFPAEGPPPDRIAGQPVGPAMATPFTMLANLCWNPAVSVPAGTSADGLPIGLQVVGRRHADEVVLRLARIFEAARPWPRTAPLPRP